MGTDGVADVRLFLELFCQLHTIECMRQFRFLIGYLTYIMQQSGTFCFLRVDVYKRQALYPALSPSVEYVADETQGDTPFDTYSAGNPHLLPAADVYKRQAYGYFCSKPCRPCTAF